MENIAKYIAGYLLQIKAIKLNPANPFTWASGWKSPIYCDNRKTLSFPEVRTYIRDRLTAAVRADFSGAEVIAGVATGAIAQGALTAQEMNLPFVYVRSSAKDHGLGNVVEGEVSPGMRVVVIEDLVSTGGSSLRAVNALREAGCEVMGMIAVFTYGFPAARKNFEKAGCTLHTLCDYEILVEHALETGYITSGQVETLKEWRNSPETWGK